MNTIISNADLHEALLDHLAYVRGQERADIDAELAANGGDLEIRSIEGQATASRLETRVLDIDDLIRPEDQESGELCSVRSLERLVRRRLDERDGNL